MSTDPAALLAGISTDALHAEIDRRAVAEQAEASRILSNTVRRHRLSSAVTTAEHKLANAAAEHARFVVALEGLVAQGTRVTAESVAMAQIRVSQGNHSRVEAKDALLSAQRELDNFEQQATR